MNSFALHDNLDLSTKSFFRLGYKSRTESVWLRFSVLKSRSMCGVTLKYLGSKPVKVDSAA